MSADKEQQKLRDLFSVGIRDDGGTAMATSSWP